MPKMKSVRGARKRFKITATGKVLRRKAGKGHLLSGKSPRRRRALRKDLPVHDNQSYIARRILGS
ncbi:MAG: 50S ribosomal protein L35 [Planctomycetales bacterium]|nr:50S ribosomal protein L35 [Planctomycetales bacterium]